MQLATRIATLVGDGRCVGCGRPHTLLCGSCARAAESPVGAGAPIGIDRMLVRWAYDGLPRALVLDLKVRAVRAAAESLGRGVVEVVRRRGTRACVLTWVPGRDRETRVRGFDHAELIARRVARDLGLPLVPLLFRRKDTVDQTGLSKEDRWVNLQGAFGSRPTSGWVGLVDDVVTSGATARACGAALRAAGCDGVELLAPCHA